MPPVRSKWCPMTIGREAGANRSWVIVRFAVPARTPPVSAVPRKLRRVSFLGVMVFSALRPLRSMLGQPEIALHDLRPGFQILGGTIVHDGALFHQEHARAQPQRGLDVLFDQQDGHAGLVDAVDLAP